VVREYFVGRSLREIEMAFDAVDLEPNTDFEPPVSGERRSFVEQYYQAIDWSSLAPVRKFLVLVEHILTDVEALADSAPTGAETSAAIRTQLVSSLERDGFVLERGRFVVNDRHVHAAEIRQSAVRLDAPELDRQLDRLYAAVDEDPSLALGTAKELIETACKTILEERRFAIDAGWDLGRLVKETRQSLHLLPDDIPDGAKGEEAIRRLLSNLGAVAQALAELRNLYGTGHGRSGKRRGIEPRHARLAAGAAAALVTFLLDTHWARP
jgi:hypothetical protein